MLDDGGSTGIRELPLEVPPCWAAADARIMKAWRDGIREHGKPGSVEDVSAETRDFLLQLLYYIEGNAITFNSDEIRASVIRTLWKKVAFLNVDKGLGHPETGVEQTVYGVRRPVNAYPKTPIDFDPRDGLLPSVRNSITVRDMMGMSHR